MINEFSIELNDDELYEAFKCILHSRSANKNTMLAHYNLLLDPQAIESKLTTLNRKYKI